MKKILHLSTCKTCQRIIGELNDGQGFELQNLKEQHIDADTLDMLAEQTGSYESLFNRRAMKYRQQGLNKRDDISEKEYRKLILGEYTFLKRPVVIVAGEAFIGNAKKTVQAAKEKLGLV